MSSIPENPDPNTSLQATRESDYLKFKRIVAWTFVIVSPIAIALPPRKLNFNTFAYSAGLSVAANYLYRENNPHGRGVFDEIGVRYFGKSDQPSSSKGISNLFNVLPTERAQEVQAKLKASKDAAAQSKNSEEELEKYKAAQRFQERSLPEKIWMGSEEEGWKEKRLREEQKALDEGKGYGDLIMDHIWEVWNWGKPGDQKKREEAEQAARRNENEK